MFLHRSPFILGGPCEGFKIAVGLKLTLHAKSAELGLYTGSAGLTNRSAQHKADIRQFDDRNGICVLQNERS